jgi:hypothetical protein
MCIAAELSQFSLAAVKRARQSQTETVYLSKVRCSQDESMPGSGAPQIMREKDVHTGQPLDDNQLAEEAMGLMCVVSPCHANLRPTCAQLRWLWHDGQHLHLPVVLGSE